MNILRLTYEPEDEWHGELRVSAQASGFTEQGTAWFNREALIGFGRALGQYPIPSHPPVAIFGGFGARTDNWPEQVQVGITITPASITGTLLARVELANDPLEGTHQHEARQQAILCFLTEYAALDRFRAELASMLDNGTEAILRGQ